MELQLIDESQETIVIISFSYSVSSLFSTIFLLLFHSLWWISCHQKVFSTVVCFALDIFGQSFYSLPCSHAHEQTGGDESLVEWIFLFVLGLHGKVLVVGCCEGDWCWGGFCEKRTENSPCQRTPTPASSKNWGRLSPSSEPWPIPWRKQGDFGISLWHVGWNDQVTVNYSSALGRARRILHSVSNLPVGLQTHIPGLPVVSVSLKKLNAMGVLACFTDFCADPAHWTWDIWIINIRGSAFCTFYSQWKEVD